MTWMFPKIVAALVALVIAIWAMTRRRRPPRRRGSSGSLGHAMQNLEGLFVESKTHVIKAERDEHSEEDDSGDPPEK